MYQTGVLSSQLAVVGAIAAAGIAIVAGVKHVRAEKQEPEPQTFGGKVKRKVTISLAGQMGKRIGQHRKLSLASMYIAQRRRFCTQQVIAPTLVAWGIDTDLGWSGFVQSYGRSSLKTFIRLCCSIACMPPCL